MPTVKKAQATIITSDAFAITPSDTINVASDPNNTYSYTMCYVHNPAAGGTVKVLPAGADDADTPVTMYIGQGKTLGENTPLLVKRIYNSSPTPPAGLIAIVPKGGSI